MHILWQGHACFVITGAGARIVTDPYTPEVAGLAPLREPAHLVVMSSDNDLFHSCPAQVPGNPAVIDALQVARNGGAVEARGVQIRAIEAMESVVHKIHPGANAMYRFEIEGVHIGHIGDTGNPFSPAQLEFLRGVDVLLALTGGPPTIDLADLDAALLDLRPALVIPMHYRIPNLRLNILPLEAFTARHAAADVEVRAETTIELSRDRLPARTRIIALQAAANAAAA